MVGTRFGAAQRRTLPAAHRTRRRTALGVAFAIAMIALSSMAPRAAAQGQNPDILTDLRRESQSARQSGLAGAGPAASAVRSDSQVKMLQNPSLKSLPSEAPEEVKASPLDPKNFGLSVLIPFSYNSNPLLTPATINDGHAKPTVGLSWGFAPTALFKFAARSELSFDRFIDTSSANADTWISAFSAALTPDVSVWPTNAKWSLYVKYRPQLTYAPDLATRTVTLQDFLGGVTLTNEVTLLGLDGVKIEMDLSAGHRSADPGRFSATIVNTYIAFKYFFLEKDNAFIELRPALDLTVYDDFDGQSRTDVRPALRVLTEWQPKWFKDSRIPILPNTSLQVLVSFVRNFSTLSSRSFNRWDVGPAVIVRTAF